MKKVIYRIFMFVIVTLLFTACASKDKSQSVAEQMSKEIKDETATISTASVESTWENLKSTKTMYLESKETVLNEMNTLLETDLQEETKKQVADLTTFYEQYPQFLELVTSYDPKNVDGSYYGSSDTEVGNNGILIYHFKELPAELKTIDYDLINQVSQDETFWAEGASQNLVILQKSNYVFFVEGNYVQKLDQIRGLLDKIK